MWPRSLQYQIHQIDKWKAQCRAARFVMSNYATEVLAVCQLNYVLEHIAMDK